MQQLAVINESTAVTDAQVKAMLGAFARQWNDDLRPVWGIDAGTFTFVPKGRSPASGAWWVVFLDDSDQAGALAYHDLTNEGLPISKVFVRSILADKASLSVGATHEICEMAVDPWLNSAYQDAHGTFWAGEVCDPVENDRYGYSIDGVLVTDFVTPDWFGHLHSKATVDLRGHAHKPFTVLAGGYAQKFDSQQGWVQVNGTETKGSRRANPAPGSRRDRRARQWRHALRPSEVVFGARG